MAYQATMNGSRRANGRGPTGMVSTLADFANDAATLAELQIKLTSLDLKQASERAARPAFVLVGTAVLTLGATPVLFLGIAEALVVFAGVNRAWALLATAGAAIGLAGVGSYFAWKGLSESAKILKRSREEFARNLAWMKNALSQVGRNSPRLPG
jgi:Putative Actinobacterial Holin-X, holin superfamily III